MPSVLWADQDALDGVRYAQTGDLAVFMSDSQVPFEIRRFRALDRWRHNQLLGRAFSISPPSNYPAVSDPFGTGDDANRSWWGLVLYPTELGFGTSSDPTNHPARPWQYALGWTVKLVETGEVVQIPPRLTHAWALNMTALVGTAWETSVKDATLNHFRCPYNIVGGSIVAHTQVPDQISVWADQPRTLFVGWDPDQTLNAQYVSGTAPVFGIDPTSQVELLATQVYRGWDGAFGFVGETTSMTFVDDGRLPDFTRPAFPSFAEQAKASPLDGDRMPKAAAFYGKRLTMAGTDEEPGRVLLSEVNDYTNMIVPPVTGPATPFSLDVRNSENIVHLAATSWGLAAFGTGSIYMISEGQDGAFSDDSAVVRDLSAPGATDTVQPVKAVNAVFYVGLDQKTVYAIVPRQDGQPTVQDTNSLSTHIFDDVTIVDMAYAESPDSILWVVLSDGTLAALTWHPEAQVVAWTHHTLAGDGLVKHIAAIPETTGETGVYMTVSRDRLVAGGTVTTLERLAPRRVSNLRDCFFLDCAATWQASAVAGETVTLTNSGSGTGNVGDTVSCVFAAGSGALGDHIALVNPDDPSEEPVYIYMTAAWAADTQDGVVASRNLPDWAYTAGIQYYRPQSSISVSTALAGRTVTVLADGDRLGDQVPTGSVLGFSNERPWGAISICAGLSYNADFRSLPSAELEGGQKVLRNVLVHVASTRGGAVGPDFDTLTDIDDTVSFDIGFGQKPLADVRDGVAVQGPIDAFGEVVYRQADPYPCTISRITREIDDRGR